MQCKHVNAMLIHVVASYWMSSADWPSCCEDVQSHVIHVLLSRDSTCRCSTAVPLLHCSISLTHLNHEDMYVKEIDTGKKIYIWQNRNLWLTSSVGWILSHLLTPGFLFHAFCCTRSNWKKKRNKVQHRSFNANPW